MQIAAMQLLKERKQICQRFSFFFAYSPMLGSFGFDSRYTSCFHETSVYRHVCRAGSRSEKAG